MKLLIIGGTRFVGRHLVTSALARNHTLTLFNRGNHPTSDFANVETIRGDRNVELSKLQGRQWDAVIDTCGLHPNDVTSAVDLLRDSVERYVFISSISVYSDLSAPGTDETGPLKMLTPEQLEEANAIAASGKASAESYGSMYGGLKALCEQAAEAAMPGRVLNIRPGLIVGPYDYTDRFTYWVVRVARGGEVLAPGPPEKFVQVIDARDLADWTVRMIERAEHGTYNATGMSNETTMETLLAQCKEVSSSDATFAWASEGFLLREKVAAWTEMPLWLPYEAAPHLSGFMSVSSDKAVNAGLTFRPLRVTISDVLGAKEPGDLKAGLSRERELELLRKLHSSSYVHQQSFETTN